jgi:glycosyltransferase involved in cell wall biosynthesis
LIGEGSHTDVDITMTAAAAPTQGDGPLAGRHVVLVGAGEGAQVGAEVGWSASSQAAWRAALKAHLASRTARLSGVNRHSTWFTRLAGRPDVVLAVSVADATAGALLARRSRCPLVVVVDDVEAAAGGRRGSSSGSAGAGSCAGLASRMLARAVRGAERLVVTTETARDQLRERGFADERIALVPAWPRLTPSTLDVAAAKRVLGWPDDRFTVVHAGSADHDRGFRTVLEAAQVLAARGNTTVDIVLACDRGEGQALRAAAGLPELRVLDGVPDSEYPTVLAAADLLLLSQRLGAAPDVPPVALTDYLAAGRPIVAASARDGAVRRTLSRASDAALCVDSGAPWNLADAISILQDDQPRRERMARSAQARAEGLRRPAALARLEAALASCLSPSLSTSDPLATPGA